VEKGGGVVWSFAKIGKKWTRRGSGGHYLVEAKTPAERDADERTVQGHPAAD
jgi:hypothetical protein